MSDVDWAPPDRKYGRIFIGELEVCSEDCIIIGGELFLGGNDFANLSPGFACFQPRFHQLGILYREIHSLSGD